MNTEEKELLTELDKKVALQSQENKHQTEIINETKETTGKIFNRLDELKCEGHHQRIKNVEKDSQRVWRWIYGIAIFVLFGGVIGIISFVVKDALAKGV